MSSAIKWNFHFTTFLQVFCKLTKFFNFNHLTLTMFFCGNFFFPVPSSFLFYSLFKRHMDIEYLRNFISSHFTFTFFFYNKMKSLQFFYVKLLPFPPSSSKHHFYNRCQSSSSTSLHFQLAWKFYNHFCMKNFLLQFSVN